MAVSELSDALLPHLDDKENTLFPALMEEERNPVRIVMLLEAMAEEHLAVGACLAEIRAVSDDFALPEWACGSYRTLFFELRQLERDVFAHVHIENHLLKQRFAAANG